MPASGEFGQHLHRLHAIMKPTLVLEFHVHSDRSHDSAVPIEKYVAYLEQHLLDYEFGVLGISDHNVIPITTRDALALSTPKVLVIPGIQWKLKKTFRDAILHLISRRDILTFGDHDDLRNYVETSTRYRILKNDEILGNFTEGELLGYLSGKRTRILIVPHPKHFVVDYYGKKQIKTLKEEVDELPRPVPFFVEEKTGYDPFPRILYHYRGKYLTIGDPDAHEIYSFLHTKSLFSVEATLSSTLEIQNLWSRAVLEKDVGLYGKVVGRLFDLMIRENEHVVIRKHYLRALLQFFHAIPRFFIRRFEDFPHNILR